MKGFTRIWSALTVILVVAIWLGALAVFAVSVLTPKIGTDWGFVAIASAFLATGVMLQPVVKKQRAGSAPAYAAGALFATLATIPEPTALFWFFAGLSMLCVLSLIPEWLGVLLKALGRSPSQ